MPLPLLSAALEPLLFTADRKRRAEPGGSTLGECHRVQYIQYLDADRRAGEAGHYGAPMEEFYRRLLERRAGYPAVEHSPHLTYMLLAEIEAIEAVIGLCEALDAEGGEGAVQYLPIPTRVVAADPPAVV